MNRPAIPSTRFCALSLATLLTVSLNAAQWECGERSNLPPEGKNYCAAGDFRHSDTKLGKVFDSLVEKYRLAFGDARSLINAQSAFETYRNNQCIAENKRIEDEPYHPMIVAQCKTRLTSLRIDEIKRIRNQIP